MTSKAEFEEVKKFEKDLGQCMKCGFCTFWCPVYQEERIESSVARGKNMMVRALLAGDLEYTKEYAERLNKCTLCMTCTANCPAKANIPNIIVAARADKVKAKGVAFPYNIVYRWLLPRRKLFGNVVRFASWFQGIFLPKTQGTIRHLSMFLSALGKGRYIPQIAPRFLRQMVPMVNKPTVANETGIRVGYFTGCMTDFVFPEVGKKVINFLTRHGVEVVVPREQGCCGAPVFLGAGDLATGRKMADTNVKAFADFDYVVADCATCSSAMKDYVKFLADTPERQEAYTKFAGKIKDITEFLVDVLKLPPSAYRAVPEAKGKKVTWHDPCHLNRHMGITRQPREILKSIPDIEYVEMPNADRCCGMAGSFSIYFYDVSQKIADKKMAGIDATGADIVVTDCPGCEFQLIDTTMRHDSPVKVMHIMELLE
ncbi:MAG TPA: (Fe-S)-binding protein [Dehalococcoidia bacterium]|nr:(Fe-S)-binding protein [Dehalococcoidia bacterium]